LANRSTNRYKVEITLPELPCQCPRSGYPGLCKST